MEGNIASKAAGFSFGSLLPDLSLEDAQHMGTLRPSAKTPQKKGQSILSQLWQSPGENLLESVQSLPLPDESGQEANVLHYFNRQSLQAQGILP